MSRNDKLTNLLPVYEEEDTLYVEGTKDTKLRGVIKDYARFDQTAEEIADWTGASQYNVEKIIEFIDGGVAELIAYVTEKEEEAILHNRGLEEESGEFTTVWDIEHVRETIEDAKYRHHPGGPSIDFEPTRFKDKAEKNAPVEEDWDALADDEGGVRYINDDLDQTQRAEEWKKMFLFGENGKMEDIDIEDHLAPEEESSWGDRQVIEDPPEFEKTPIMRMHEGDTEINLELRCTCKHAGDGYADDNVGGYHPERDGEHMLYFALTAGKYDSCITPMTLVTFTPDQSYEKGPYHVEGEAYEEYKDGRVLLRGFNHGELVKTQHGHETFVVHLVNSEAKSGYNTIANYAWNIGEEPCDQADTEITDFLH